MNIAIREIVADPSIDIRDGMDAGDHLEEYMEVFDTLPPVIVFERRRENSSPMAFTDMPPHLDLAELKLKSKSVRELDKTRLNWRPTRTPPPL